jgi:hypothetical protein
VLSSLMIVAGLVILLVTYGARHRFTASPAVDER